MRRKHRRKYSTDATCGCPPGTKKVDTCSTKRGTKVCRGRGFGCLGIGTSKRGKPTPRWFPMSCQEPDTVSLPRQADQRALLPPDVPQTIPPPPRKRKKRKKLVHEVM
jgi:hypothetical protein